MSSKESDPPKKWARKQVARQVLKRFKQMIFGEMFDREQEIGLLQDTIINHALFFPNQQETALEHSTAPAGRYVGYDFHREEEFGKKVKRERRQVKIGRLMVFALEEIQDNGPDDLTPTNLLDIFDIRHALQINALPISEMVQHGYVREDTYEQAYKRVGLYERYRRGIVLIRPQEQAIYSVTPKGNGVVFLIKDGGEKNPKPQGDRQLSPSFS